MANSKIRLNGKTVKMPTSTSSSSSKKDMQKSISNYKKRLSAVGVDAEEATDKRNFIEKALNLKEDQNVLFDIFEILNRPQNALFTGIDSALSGGSFGEGLLEGITGETDTTGKDLLVSHTGLDDNEGALDLADILGFGLDIVADPVDWALIPATGGGSLAFKSGSQLVGEAVEAGAKKALKAADKAIDASLALSDSRKLANLEKLVDEKGFKSVEEMLTKTGQEIPHAQESYAKLKRDLGAIFDSNKSVNGMVGASRNARNEANFSKLLQNEYIKSVEDATNEYYDNLVKTQGKDVADEFLRLVDSEDTDALVNVLEYDRDYSASASRWWDNVKAPKRGAKIKDYSLTGMTRESLDRVGEILSKYNIDYTITKKGNLQLKQKDISEFKNIPELKEAFKRIDDTFTVNDGEDINKIRKLLDDNSISYKKVKGKNEITITDDINKLKNNKELKPYADRLGLRTKPTYTDEQVEQLEEALDLYKNKFGDYYEARKKDFQNLAEINKNQTGIDLHPITDREGYVRRAYNAEGRKLFEPDDKDVVGGSGLINERVFGPRNKGSALEEQNMRTLSYEKTIEKTQKQIKNLKKKTQANQIKDLRQQKRAVTKNLKIKKAQLDENLKKLDIKQEAYQQLIDDTTKAREEIATMFSGTLKDKVRTVYNAEGMEKVKKIGDKYLEAVDNTNNLLSTLANREAFKGKGAPTRWQIQDKLAKAKETELRLQKRYKVQLTRALSYLDKQTDSTIKAAARAIKKNNKATAKITKAEGNLKNTLARIDKLTTVRGDTVSHLEDVIDRISYKIENAKNLPASYEKYRLNQIKNLQQKLSTLKAEGAPEVFDYAYSASLGEFVNESTEYTRAVKIVNDALAGSTLYNPDFIMREADLVGELPRNFANKLVDGNILVTTLQKSKGVLPDDAKAINDAIDFFAGKKFYVDKELGHLLNVLERTNNDTNAFVKVLDKINSSFKKFSVMTPGFQLRNIIGNATNMYLAGMPPHQIISYWGKANNILNNSEDLIRKVATGAKLSDTEKEMFKIIKGFNEAGFEKIGDAVQDLDDVRNALDSSPKAIKWAAKMGMDMNQYMDTYNRMAMYIYATEHPKFVQKLGKSSAAEAVKFALMDPSNLNDFERNVARRVIPFYTFTKQNLLYQASNILKNTPKYRRLGKFINDAYNDLDEDQHYQYQKESMQLPIPWANDENGNQWFLKANLPVSDLGEWMENPVQRLFASTNPLIKMGAEMTTGKDLFTGQDLRMNTTKKLLNSLGVSDIPEGVTNTAQLAEHILSGLGLSNISTNVIKKVTAIINSATNNDDVNGAELWAEIFRSVVQNTNQDSVENSKLYEEYETYQNLIKQLKEQGVDVPTIQQMQKSGQIKLNKLKNKRTRVY